MQYLSVCLWVQLSCGASRQGQRGHSDLRPATGQAVVMSVISVFSLFSFLVLLFVVTFGFLIVFLSSVYS